MNRLNKLKSKSKKYTISIIVISIVVFSLLLYYIGNGFSLNDLIINTHDDCRINIVQPSEGTVCYNYDTIKVSGTMWGGIPKKVLVWDDRYNVPISCSISGSTFATNILANDISTGNHILCIQGQTQDGRWTSIEKVSIEKRGDSYSYTGQIQPRTWSESFFPEPIATIFRPVEEVLSHVVVYVSGGTSDDDLNGDNIPDELQQSPVSPRQNPMNVPLSSIIVFGFIILVILVLIIYVISPYLKHRYQKEREIRRSPEQRKWSLKMRRDKEQKLRRDLFAERTKRRKIEEKLELERKKRIEAQSQRPVNIFFTKKRGKEERL